MELMQQANCGLFTAGAIALIFIFGFTGAPLFLWTLLGAGMLYIYGASQTTWIVAGVIAAIFNIRPLRAVLVSSILMKIMKALEFVPSISQTERTAIEAGSVWVEGELFSGKPNFKKILSEPYPSLTKDELAFVNGPVEKLCEMIDDWKISQSRDIPKEVWDFIKKEKFLGMIIPKEYGGLGFSALAHSEVIKKVSTRSISACISIMVPNSLGPAELLIHYGTDEQKKRLLPRLAAGDEMPCFALTEPGAGSDAGSIQASGELFRGDDGKLYMKLNWDKRWITLAAISTILGLAFRLKDPKNLLGKGEDLGITCALIPSNTPGVVLGLRHDPLNTPFYNCPTRGKDVIISVDTIVGGIEQAGNGWKMLMECLGAGRGISLPSQSTGGTQLCAMVASAHSSIRKQFGLPIGKFEGVEEPLARITAAAYLLEASRKYTCGALDKGIKPAVVTAIAKFNSTEIARKAVIDAMDIMGGAGISRGPRNLLSNIYTAMPIGITVEGANILTRTLMIFGQGALRAHPYAFKEVNSLEKGNITGFDQAFWGHIGHVVRNTFRSVGLSLTRGRLFIAPVSGPTAKYYKKLAWASASFAILADIAMGTLGGKLKFKEKITGRFADILSWMYLCSAVLRRFEAEGRKEEDLPIVHYCLQHGLANMQEAFDGIFSNFRANGLTWIFNSVLRMWSSINRLSPQPSDFMGHKVAKLVLQQSPQRDRLVEGVFIPKNAGEQLKRLEDTMKVVLAAENTERKVKQAVRSKQLPKMKGLVLFEEALKKGVISQGEFNDLSRSESMRAEAIKVDEFTLDEYAQRK